MARTTKRQRVSAKRETTVKNYNLNATRSAVDDIERASEIEGERFPGRWILRAAHARAREVIAEATYKG